jgi:hypothetical protein
MIVREFDRDADFDGIRAWLAPAFGVTLLPPAVH